MEQSASVGAWIKRRRAILDLTREELAQQVGCAVITLYKIEADARRPSRQLAQRLAPLLELPSGLHDTFVQVTRAQLPVDRLPRPADVAARASHAHQAESAPHRPHSPQSLPIAPNALVGRTTDVANVIAALRRPDVRLLTLTGPGGVGKTRLAIQVGAELRDSFAEAIAFVNLAPVRAPDLVLPTIAQALDVTLPANQPPLRRLAEVLSARRLLLVLDNFEQVLPAAAALAELLSTTSRLKLLVTSRAALHLAAEHEYPVMPLALPPKIASAGGAVEQALSGKIPVSLLVAPGQDGGDSDQYAAVSLFVERARAVKPDLVVTPEILSQIGDICHRLDGLPLAIELAAARVKLIPPGVLLQRLERRLPLLTGGARDLPARHHTLHDTIDWSYQLLDDTGQILFQRLAVFEGGCTLEAAEAVLRTAIRGPSDQVTPAVLSTQSSVLDGLTALVDQSLLRQSAGPDGEPRFQMLETIREYALERLEMSGAVRELRQRHAAYYLALGEQAERGLSGPALRTWLERIEADYHNIGATLEWATAQGEFVVAGRLVAALGFFWDMRSHHREGRAWLATVLEHSDSLPIRIRVKVRFAAAWLAWRHMDFVRARALLEQSLAEYRALDDEHGIAMTVITLGCVISWQGSDWLQATSFLRDGLARCRALGNEPGIAWALYGLGDVETRLNNLDVAYALCAESLALRRRLGNPYDIAWSLAAIGYVAMARGAYPEARVYHEERLAIERSLGHHRGSGAALTALVDIAYRQGDYAAARAWLEEALQRSRENGDMVGISMALLRLGQLACIQGDWMRAIERLTAALELCREQGDDERAAWALHHLGRVAYGQGKVERAGFVYREGLEIFRQQGITRGVAWSLVRLAALHHNQGDETQAIALLQESLILFHQLKDSQGIAWGLEYVGTLVGRRARGAERALQLFGAAAADRNPMVVSPLLIERAPHERAAEAIRAQCDAASAAAAWAAGQALTLDQIIAEIPSLLGGPALETEGQSLPADGGMAPDAGQSLLVEMGTAPDAGQSLLVEMETTSGAGQSLLANRDPLVPEIASASARSSQVAGVSCRRCGSVNLRKNGRTRNGRQQVYCNDCHFYSTLDTLADARAQQRALIEQLRAAGVSQSEIARVTGMSRTTIRGLIKHRRDTTGDNDPPLHKPRTHENDEK